MKYLFRTNNTEEVEKRFKNAYVFEKPSGAKEEIRRIFDEENNFTIILHHIDNKSILPDLKLFKILFSTLTAK